MENKNGLLEIVKEFLHALENRKSPTDVLRFYHPEIIQTEYPNAVTKNVTERNMQELAAASERGQKLLSKETYEILHAHEAGNTVIIEAKWTGTLSVAVGQIPAGGNMVAHFAQFLEFKDGKIYRQRNYDCFDPFM